MDAQQVTTLLAVAILVVVLPVLFLARSVTRGALSRRSSAIARELGLTHVRSHGMRREPRLEGLALFRVDRRMAVGNLMRGTYRGRQVLLADVLELPALPSAGRWGLAGVLTVLGGLLGPILGGVVLLAFPRLSQAVNYLVILFDDPLPTLPDFLLRPRSAPTPALVVGRGPEDAWGLAVGPTLQHEFSYAGGDPNAIPPAFFDRAGHVLVGRQSPWTVQATGGRLAVWISGWRSPTNLRPARSYRSVLDDALSLRDALDPDSDADADPETLAGSPAGRKSIRDALERIRDQPGPNHGG